MESTLVPTASAAVICGSALSSGLITAAQAPHPTEPPYTEPSVNTKTELPWWLSTKALTASWSFSISLVDLL